MKFRDRSFAKAAGITKERYEQLISAPAEDRHIFLTNLIEPFVVSWKETPRVSADTWKMIAMAILVGGSLWLLFADYITSMPSAR